MNIEVLHIACAIWNSILKAILIIFHNGSNYYYHFIIKGLAEEFEAQFTCLGENTKNVITFSVPLVKEVKIIGKNGQQITKTLSYKVMFIDSGRFMTACKYYQNINIIKSSWKSYWKNSWNKM